MLSLFYVRAKGIEPIRLTAPDPKSGLSTNFNTPANFGTANVQQFLENAILLKQYRHKIIRNRFQALY